MWPNYMSTKSNWRKPCLLRPVFTFLRKTEHSTSEVCSVSFLHLEGQGDWRLLVLLCPASCRAARINRLALVKGHFHSWTYLYQFLLRLLNSVVSSCMLVIINAEMGLWIGYCPAWKIVPHGCWLRIFQ